MKNKKQTQTDRRGFMVLAPFANWCAENRGSYVRIAEELSQRTHRKQFTSNVRNWLEVHWKDRTEPRFGLGLMLVDLWKEIEAGAWPKKGEE